MIKQSRLPESVATALFQRAQKTLSEPSVIVGLKVIAKSNKVVDETTQVVAVDSRNRLLRFIICTPVGDNDLIHRNITRSESVRAILGKELGGKVLIPLEHDVVEGYRYAIYPYCRPLSNARVMG